MIAGWLSLRLAFAVRFYLGPPPSTYAGMMYMALPMSILAKALAADLAGLTRSMWRYAAFPDIRRVFAAAVGGSLLLIAGILIWIPHRFPIGPLLLDFLFTFGFFSLIRFSGRALFESQKGFRDFRSRKRLPVLIVGAGDEGELTMRYLWHATARPVRVVGFVDDDADKQGRSLHGIPILGKLSDLPKLIDKHQVKEVIIALPQADPAQLRQLFITAVDAGCRVGILPELTPTDDPSLHRNPIREVRLADFLGREPVKLDPAPVRASLTGLRVLVTGAGGSIGSELCRQIARFPVAELLMLDMAENALFEINEEITALPNAPTAKPLLCDIRFPNNVERLFLEEKPDVIFHAAACKHVSMMELHPLDAARTNVLGTRNVIEAARKAEVKRFLHVSTDKAVEGAEQIQGIMGASKALSERVVRDAALSSGFAYGCVRFGNVLGSNGSVIPLFEKQLKRGGPLKVTHKDATRYFMTIEEAVTLMLHAETLQGSGEIYILDMGEPVSIMRLAEQMLQLSGRTDTGNGGIEIIGLRPGERLHEHLVSEGQTLEPTPVPKVNRLAQSPASGTREELAHMLGSLEKAVEQMNEGKILGILKKG
ncbi:MAG: polysaccharide biosynthesis protein [Verrucomicrobia bacterium]|nr:polysaccharide biosynthesis protein [Verrucomicrobiota bacterium]